MKTTILIFLSLCAIGTMDPLFGILLSRKGTTNVELINQCREKSKNPDFEYYLWDKKYRMINYCYMDYAHQKTFQNDIETYLTSDDNKNSTLVTNIKSEIENLVNCFATYLNEFLVCFEENDDSAKSIRQFKSNFQKMLNFIFDNNAQAVIDFKANHGIECVKENQEKFNVCGTHFANLSTTIKFPSFVSNPDESTMIENGKTCYIEAFKTCNNEVISDLITRGIHLISNDVIATMSLFSGYEPGDALFVDSEGSYLENQVILITNLKNYYENERYKKDKMIEFLNGKIEELTSLVESDVN